MNADDLGWAFLFLVIVALIVVVGVLVGMIVARRVDSLQAPRPARPADAHGPARATDDPAPDPGRQPAQEDQEP